MATALPRLIAFGSGTESNMTWLQYVATEGEWHRRVQLTSSMLVSNTHFTKFEMVRASSGQDLFHIRTTFNNKFLRLQSQGTNVLVAAADDRDENHATWSCTLFRRVFDGNNRVGFFHLSLNVQNAVSISTTSSLIMVRNSTSPRYFQFVDMSTVLYLPRHVSFVGNNQRYLSSRYIRTRNRLQFASTERLDSTVHHETTTRRDGWVQLRSKTFNNQLWRRSSNEWIWCDTTNANDAATFFYPRRLNISGNEHTIALLSTNAKFCMRWIRAGQPRLIETLTASASNVEPLAEMIVQEAIRDRIIYGIRYRMDEVRIYDVEPFLSLPQSANNWSYTETQRQSLSYSYERITRETFSSSHSWKVSYATTITVSIIPKLVQGVVEIDAQYEGNVEWSKVHEERETVTSSVEVSVPPRTRSEVTLVVGRGTIDVPYSFKQEDVLLDYTRLITNFDDGLFTGRNTYVFHYDIREFPLDGERNDGIVRRHYIIKPPPPRQPPTSLPKLSSFGSLEEEEEEAREEEDEAREEEEVVDQVFKPSKL